MTQNSERLMDRVRLYYVEKDRRRPISEQDVKKFENEIGYALPEDYRAFLMNYGMTASEGSLRVRDPADPADQEGITSVEVFFGLNPGTKQPRAELQSFRSTGESLGRDTARFPPDRLKSRRNDRPISCKQAFWEGVLVGSTWWLCGARRGYPISRK